MSVTTMTRPTTDLSTFATDAGISFEELQKLRNARPARSSRRPSSSACSRNDTTSRPSRPSRPSTSATSPRISKSPSTPSTSPEGSFRIAKLTSRPKSKSAREYASSGPDTASTTSDSASRSTRKPTKTKTMEAAREGMTVVMGSLADAQYLSGYRKRWDRENPPDCQTQLHGLPWFNSESGPGCVDVQGLWRVKSCDPRDAGSGTAFIMDDYTFDAFMGNLPVQEYAGRKLGDGEICRVLDEAWERTMRSTEVKQPRWTSESDRSIVVGDRRVFRIVHDADDNLATLDPPENEGEQTVER